MNQKQIQETYHKLHRYCPKCNSSSLERTCIGIIFGDLESAEDDNRVGCLNCKWSGIVHELIENPKSDYT